MDRDSENRAVKLDPALPMPLYMQVRDLVLMRILRKTWKPGEKLPADRLLSKQLGVNHITLGKALNMLRSEGYLVRYQGHGTFVAENPPQPQPDAEGRRRRRVAVLLDAVGETTFLTDLFVALFNALEANGLGMQLLSAKSDPGEQCRQLAEIMADGELAGAIVWSIMPDAKLASLLKERRPGFPVVFLDRYPKGCLVDYSGQDDYAAGFFLGEAVSRLGFPGALLLQAKGEMRRSTIRRRIAGFEAAFGRPVARRALCTALDGNMSAWDDEVGACLASGPGRIGKPLAALDVSDVIAPSIHRVLAADADFARRYELAYIRTVVELPALNVRMDVGAMGVQSVNLLARRLNGDASPPISLEAPCALDENSYAASLLRRAARQAAKGAKKMTAEIGVHRIPVIPHRTYRTR